MQALKVHVRLKLCVSASVKWYPGVY